MNRGIEEAAQNASSLVEGRLTGRGPRVTSVIKHELVNASSTCSATKVAGVLRLFALALTNQPVDVGSGVNAVAVDG